MVQEAMRTYYTFTFALKCSVSLRLCTYVSIELRWVREKKRKLLCNGRGACGCTISMPSFRSNTISNPFVAQWNNTPAANV